MTNDATIAARVPVELRNELEAKVLELQRAGYRYPDGRDVDKSYVIRVALRRYLDDTSTALHLTGTFGNLDGPGVARNNDPPTAKAAASSAPGRKGSQRRLALEAFADAGRAGLTTDEVVVKLHPRPHNGIARRVTDLLQGGLIVPVSDVDENGVHYRTRPTRTGSSAQVWVITDLGRQVCESCLSETQT